MGIKGLAERGHHVALITNYAVKGLQSLTNVEQIELESLKIDPSMFGDPFKKALGDGGSTFDHIKQMTKMLTSLEEKAKRVADAVYTNPQVLQLIESGKFDLVLGSQFFSSASYPLAWHFNATLALYSPLISFPGYPRVLGDSDHTEYVPNPLMDMSDRMSLPQRIINTVSTFMVDQLFRQQQKSPVYSEIKTLLPDCPPLDEIEKETSLVFTNSHPIFHYPRTMTPEMIEIGGIHCKPANPLPPVLEKFVGDHEPGFIIFGVGSAMNMNDMPEFMIKAFVEVFGQLPQRVIWQWKGETRANLPDNIMTVEWMPQQDLLGHKNCRLFLTHGGLNSLMEAVYHGVPVLGLPFFNDQYANVIRAQREGYALQLKWKDITKESLFAVCQELINNPRFSETAEKLSELMRDQPETPLERAVYWTEFVMRHKGARHLRLGSRYLAPYQRALIDVYCVIAAVILLPIALLVFVIRKCCCSKRVKPQDDKKRQ